MNREAAVTCDRRVEQRDIDVDQMKLGWVAGVENVPREVSAIGADFSNAGLLRQVLHQFVARSAHAALAEQLRRNSYRGLPAGHEMTGSTHGTTQRCGRGGANREGQAG